MDGPRDADPGDGLLDLSGLSLRDLDRFGESSLSYELRRVLRADLDDSEAIAGWSNSV